MIQETILAKFLARSTVVELVRGGVLLIEIVNSSKYSPEIKQEALDRMRENVLSCQAGRRV